MPYLISTVNKKLSTIGITTPQGIKAICAGWNGEPMHDGQILANCWTNAKSVGILIGLGDLVYLGPDVFSTQPHHRDFHRDWDAVAPRRFFNVRDWKKQMRLAGCGCFYLFNANDNKWIIWDEHGHIRLDIAEFLV
jgi:hypothetical protein